MSALCASLVLGLHLGTLHFVDEAHKQDINPGAYVECDDWVAGAYFNSIRRESVYAGRVWHWGPVDVLTGAVTGYRGARVLPLVAPSLRVADTGFRVTLLPPVRESGWGGLHLSYEHRF